MPGMTRYCAVCLLLVSMAAQAAPATAPPKASDNPAAPPVTTAKYYAVTLVTAFAPITDKEQLRVTIQIDKEFPSLVVYQTKDNVFGKEIYFLRLGFFASFADATAIKTRALATYPGAWATEVPEREYLTALTPKPTEPRVAAGTEKKPGPAEPQPTPKPLVTEKPPVGTAFALNLDSSPSAELRPSQPLPRAFESLRLYLSRLGEGERTRYLLNLGFFAGEAEAEAARKQILKLYPNASVIQVSPQEQQDSLKTALAMPATIVAVAAVPTATAPPPPAGPLPKEGTFDRQAGLLMEEARAALTRNDTEAAINLLNQVLQLPPNKYSQDAAEFIGVAYERAGEIAKARKEYQLYLKLYPTGEGAERVRQRLAALSTATATAALKRTKPSAPTQTTVYGSLSQYIYHGSSKSETTTTTATTTDTATLSATDQKSLITNIDLTQRTRSDEYDNRAVFRDTHINNYLRGQDDRNRVTSLYYELKNRKSEYSVRAGRQSGSSGGAPGRFDGVFAGVNVSPKWRVNVVGGEPVETPIESSRSFYGTSLDFGTFAEHWSGSVYTVKALVDSVTDRQAVGTELRYFDPKKSFFTLVDYDTSFGALNTAMFQGNWQGGTSTSYNMLIDHRRAPSLQLVSSLIGESTTSIRTLLQTRTYEELQAQARAVTATTDLYLFGATHPLNTKWQIGGDVRYSRTSGTAGTATIPPTASSGNAYTYSGQMIGTAIFSKRDITVFSVSHTEAQTYTDNSVTVANRALLGEKWSFDTSLRWYAQEDNLGTQSTRITPTFKTGYKWKERMTIEAEIGVEDGTTRSTTTNDVTRRHYWSLGYRWDF